MNKKQYKQLKKNYEIVLKKLKTNPKSNILKLCKAIMRAEIKNNSLKFGV